MSPIEDYFTDLLPHESSKVLKLKPFQESVLLLNLRRQNLPSKQIKFYSAYIRSENFKNWLRKEKKKKLGLIEKKREGQI